MAKKNIPICETCGAKMCEYKFGLSKGLVEGIKCALDLCEGNPSFLTFHDVSHETKYGVAGNFHKLRYWGITEKVKDKKGCGGTWRLTEKGIAFASGELALPKSVWTYRHEVVRFDDEEIFIGDITDGWKYRPDYLREARPHDLSGDDNRSDDDPDGWKS